MLLGISLKIASAFVFTLMSAGVKVSAATYPTLQVVFFRSLFGLVVLCVWLWARGEFPSGLATKRVSGHLLRGIVGVVSMMFGFGALFMLPLADATALAYVSPLMAVVLAAVFLGETVRIYRWSAVIIGFCGVVVMVWEHVGGHGGGWGILVALGGACLGAVAGTQTRRLTQTETTGAIVFYFSCIASALSGFGLFVASFWAPHWPLAEIVRTQAWIMPLSAWDLGLLVFTGIVGGMGQILMTQSFRYADASIIACFDYTSMIWALLLAAFLFGESPSVYVLIGASIIALSGLFVIWREHRLGLIRREVRKVSPTRQL